MLHAMNAILIVIGIILSKVAIIYLQAKVDIVRRSVTFPKITFFTFCIIAPRNFKSKNSLCKR